MHSVVPDAVAQGLEEVERFFAQRPLAVALAADPGSAGHPHLKLNATLSDRTADTAPAIVAAGDDASDFVTVAAGGRCLRQDGRGGGPQGKQDADRADPPQGRRLPGNGG